MGIVSLSPVCDSNLSQTLSFHNNNNNNHLREASFSSYLNRSEKEFVLKLAESTRGQEKDGGIEVFGAEKYFNGGMDTLKSLKLPPRKHHYQPSEQLDNIHLNPKKQPKSSVRSGTPSVRSEYSFNSQKALLRKNPSRVEPNNSSKTKGFLYKCSSCCDKKSVQVDPDATPSKIATVKPPTKTGISFKLEEQQQDRKSIEVFGSSSQTRLKRNSAMNLEKRLPMLSWNDVAPRAEKKTNLCAAAAAAAEDSDSDTSSDLFEIESLMAKPNSNFHARKGSDGTDSVTPTTCYAPSEASIEWSVITASDVDFSISSEFDSRRQSTASSVRVKPCRSSNLRTGCNSQKAVKVAGDGLTASEAPPIGHRSESFGRLARRFEAEAKLFGFSPNQRRHALATNSLPRPYSPQISNILYA